MSCSLSFGKLRGLLLFAAALPCVWAGTSRAVVHLDAADNPVYRQTPGDNSGWQFEGEFGAYLGTPIAPNFFLTAKHIGGSVGDSFTFHGETFQTTAVFPDPDSDLQIWQVDHPFATYAPVYQPSGATETGQELRVHGRGTDRGSDMDLDDTLRGWAWGAYEAIERWGSNVVTAILPSGTDDDWNFLQVAFDSPGVPGEAHLSVGDSGGGLFILQNGLWRLAGINYAVDDLFTAPDGSTGFAADIFDARGYYTENDDGSFTLLTGDANVPTCFYDTQISVRFSWIEQVVGPIDTLPAEDFSAWQTAYFTPDQIADGTVSGPMADPDGDGVPNLLEFAFSLDPTYPEPVLMTAGTGLRGLPLVQLEQIAPFDQRLTVEFVRRTASSGSGVTYATQFTSDLQSDWETGGTETVTAINERWERVKVTDTVSVGGTTQARFARVLVSQDQPVQNKTPARTAMGKAK